MQLKIGISGTRGIPNRYGGFEQCAEYLASGLVKKGHEVFVYNSHRHEYRDGMWNGVHIIHCQDPEHKIGTAGQFLYDLNCFLDARKRKFDVLLQLGYTSSSLWVPFWPKGAKNIVNMDGLEWKRSKYSRKVQWFLKKAEKWAARNGDMLIADSPGIQEHLRSAFDRPSVYIPYGAELFTQPDAEILSGYRLTPFAYDLLIARMEPENNIETIIRAHMKSDAPRPLIVVGKTENRFGAYLRSTYASGSILFLGSIYEADIVNNLRYHSFLYFHGHSVGGTNPSLLEAMGCSCLIAAHDNIFNRSILGSDAFYFSHEEELAEIIGAVRKKEQYAGFVENNKIKIRDLYSWPRITDMYEQAFFDCLK